MKTSHTNLFDSRIFKKPLTLILLTVLSCVTVKEASAQLNRPLRLLPGAVPPVVPAQPGQGNIADTGRGATMSLRSIDGKSAQNAPRHQFGRALDLTHGKVKSDSAMMIPHWSDSFTYNGLVYNYTMVGTDPKRGSATTVIPTVLIPLRFVFADGNVFDASTDIVDGQTPIQGFVNSPIFQNYNFNNNAATYFFGSVAGLVRVGNTQYGDAFQRANFWDSVSTRAPNYHVLLGQPTVLPTQTINVPAGSFSYYLNPISGQLAPLVDDTFLVNLVNPVLTVANVSPTTLPIMLWGKITSTEAGAFHGVTSLSGNTLQTFIAAPYLPGTFFQTVYGPNFRDVYPLSHEVVEWMDDPFNNFTPGWDFPFLTPTDVRCDSGFVRDLLEVADPVEVFVDSEVALPGGAFTYHVTEAMFIDFYTRASKSRSYNGQYSFFEMGVPYGLLTRPSSSCTGHVEFTPTFVDFPGAIFTVVTAMNNPGLVVGFYTDVDGAQHGFIFNGSTYSALDYPGSLLTYPYKINNAGLIVGTFVDSADGTHGFSYNKGRWTQVDFPGSFDTEVYGTNAAGDIVGTYDGSQPVTHAFLLQNGQYQRVDTPFGTQAEGFAINDPGSITGIAYTDPAVSSTAFIRSRSGFSTFAFPGSVFTQLSSINNSNDLAGSFADPDGSFWGMVTVSGIPYQVYAGVFGNDHLDRICGYTFDFNTAQYRGFIGTLPLQRNAH